MSARGQLVRTPFAAAMMAVATAGMAELPMREAAPMLITQEAIHRASRAMPLAKNLPSALRMEHQQPDLIRAAPGNHAQLPHGCSRKSTSLCYDYRTGHAVYKPMRSLLPVIPGMAPHNLSIRRDKIVAQYTFK